MGDYPEIKSSTAFGLVDLGDDVVGLELRSKLGVVNSELIDGAHEILDELATNYAAVVVLNMQKHFSVGANLKQMSEDLAADNLDRVDDLILRGQQWLTSLRRLAVPVVTAPFGLALGGGSELTASSWASVADKDVSIGLVEANVGLIPGWGGIVEQMRATASPASGAEPTTVADQVVPALVSIFDRVRNATTAKGAAEAKEFNFLRPDDRIVDGRDTQVAEAKDLALSLVATPERRPLETELFQAGRVGFDALQQHLDARISEESLSTHDVKIATHIMLVLTGGQVDPSWVPEQLVRDAERQNLVELAGTTATRERIDHILATGKPLKN